MRIFDLISKEDLEDFVERANVIITHGGVGSIIMALQKNKKVIAVPRLSKYDEHVNDHQRDIVNIFNEKGYIIGIQNVEDLSEAIKSVNEFKPNTYVSNNERMINLIEEFIEKI